MNQLHLVSDREFDQVEWDYFTGHVDDGHGQAYGVQVTFFYVGAKSQVHFALTDLKTGKYDQKIQLLSTCREGNSKGAGISGPIPFEFGSAEITVEFGDGPRYLHGDQGWIDRYGEKSFYESWPQIPMSMKMRDGLFTWEGSGFAWHDHEQIPLSLLPLKGWDWMSLRFPTGDRVMLYGLKGTKRFGTRFLAAGPRALSEDDFAVTVTDSYFSIKTGRVYPCEWDVRLDDRTFTVKPAVRDQEFIADPRHLSYWEGYCRVYEGDAEVGHAYVEMAGYPTQSERDMAERWMLGNKEAIDLLVALGMGSQIADDFTDEDVKPGEGSERMSRLLYTLLGVIPNNPFYQKNRGVLEPIVLMSVLYWDASNDWAESPRRDTRMFGYAYREILEQAGGMAALLLGGHTWARKVIREMHDFYHVFNGDPFDKWEGEHGYR